MIIRDIEKKDMNRVLDIYSPYIRNSIITFEYDVPSVSIFCDRVERVIGQFPWLVCEIEGKIAGYAYASHYRERTAFSWDCELSIYLDPAFSGRGIGKVLYSRLIELVTMQGYFQAYALVSLPNIRSEKLHESLGFEFEGRLKNVGYKLNQWIDLGQYVKRLKPLDDPGSFPMPYNTLNKRKIKDILKV
ncbi:MAG TPA: N-acetyltransferase [Candidatus Merdenecus merdavium]|nr:N-acetyltransferase [Candidatus Merdenecus merdavium]